MTSTILGDALADQRIGPLGVRQLRLDLASPWGPGVGHLDLVVVDVVDADGVEGSGYTWTPAVAAAAIAAVIRDDIDPFVAGRGGAYRWSEVADHLRDAGRGGVTMLALAAVDLAMWDLVGRAAHRSLRQLFDGPTSCPAYASGINWYYSCDDLVAQVGRFVNEGADAVKIKVGSPRSLGEDRGRIAAVREVVGARRRLMIDANQRWTIDEAQRAVDELADLAPSWIEEPVDANDFGALAALAEMTTIPLAVGENLHHRHDFTRAIDAGAGVIQPSVARVGGITPFLDIVTTATAAGVTVAPHLMPEVAVQLAGAGPVAMLVEVAEGASLEALGALDQPAPVELGWANATITDHPGVGLHFAGRPPRRNEQQ